MDYSDIEQCLATVRTLTGLTDRDALARIYLTDSAGKSAEGTTIYRPYFVASFLIRTNRADQTLTNAGDATFQVVRGAPTETLNLPALVLGFLEQQLRLDSALNLTIPPGFAAVPNPGGIVMSIVAG